MDKKRLAKLLQKKFSAKDDHLSYDELLDLMAESHGCYLGKLMLKEWELSEQKQKNAKLEKEHGDSLALLFENEFQKIQLAELKKLADEANASKSMFLANMSHEIRTPMNGVIAAADLALSEKLSPKVERYLEIIHSSGYALLGIINDILDFSKIEADKLELEATPFKIDEVLENIVGLFTNKVKEKEIELLIDIEPGTPLAVFGDPLRLQQVITNLVGNAIKFTDKGGTISIGVVDLTKTSNTVELRFYVKDTGVGISADYLDRLFEPFTQEDASTTRKYGGTGLGLTISKKLTEMMGGRIWAQSEIGKGTTFFFSANLVRQPKDQEDTFPISKDIEGFTTLVVDDSPDSRTITKKMLNSFGLIAETASSGTEAIKKIKQYLSLNRRFDLIIMDWIMPEIDGIETAKKIFNYVEDRIPTILMTAFTDAVLAGINRVISKPISVSTLFDAIMDVFGMDKPGRIKVRREEVQRTMAYKKGLKGTRVLLTEDNATNQEIATAILESAGIEFDVANNGQEAVDAVLRGNFDAVLMDVQMPVMDGYQATAAIRKKEQFESLPIIAMTAHAMKGDKEKCLNAGMNGYVSKPINQEILFRTLWNLVKPGQEPPFHDQDAGEGISAEGLVDLTGIPSNLPGIDIPKAMELIGISWETFKEILRGFLTNNTDVMESTREAFENKDWEKLKMVAHTIKGSSANIGADDLSAEARELEKASAMAELNPPPPAMVERFGRSLEEVFASIRSLEESEAGNLETDKAGDVNPAGLVPLLYRFANIIALSDPIAIKNEMENARKYLDASIIEILETHIHAYNYDDAAAILNGIAENMDDLVKEA